MIEREKTNYSETVAFQHIGGGTKPDTLVLTLCTHTHTHTHTHTRGLSCAEFRWLQTIKIKHTRSWLGTVFNWAFLLILILPFAVKKVYEAIYFLFSSFL
jgi:hypothetical protein